VQTVATDNDRIHCTCIHLAPKKMENCRFCDVCGDFRPISIILLHSAMNCGESPRFILPTHLKSSCWHNNFGNLHRLWIILTTSRRDRDAILLLFLCSTVQWTNTGLQSEYRLSLDVWLIIDNVASGYVFYSASLSVCLCLSVRF